MAGPTRDEEFLLSRLNQRVGRLLQEIDKFNIAEYMQLLNSPWRFFWVNFLGGVGRGVGAALGATIVAAIVISVLQRIVVLNLPVIGDYIAEIVQIVQSRM
ncbi:MAG: DUF5665 domain-containing protein [Bacillota bacterium]|nr:DUF5665 domain-containing protein [Bacillota bacterium]MDW7683994.1 DUF5665 domain-containing protein [Bacillota bacterium]